MVEGQPGQGKRNADHRQRGPPCRDQKPSTVKTSSPPPPRHLHQEQTDASVTIRPLILIPAQRVSSHMSWDGCFRQTDASVTITRFFNLIPVFSPNSDSLFGQGVGVP